MRAHSRKKGARKLPDQGAPIRSVAASNTTSSSKRPRGGAAKSAGLQIFSDSDRYIDDCCEALRKAGFRITQPRLSVLGCLASAAQPLSIRDILAVLEGDSRSQNIDKVSIYRIVETLLKLGLIHQVFPSGHYLACTHTSCRSSVHVITHCSKCGKTDEHDMPETVAGPTLNYLLKEFRFTASKHAIQIDGRCAECGG